ADAAAGEAQGRAQAKEAREGGEDRAREETDEETDKEEETMSDDVRALLDAAYAHDRAGDERGAIKFYDAAYRAGVPDGERRKFLVGYGSTLRNVGRADDAVAILAQAVADDPAYPAFAAFLALA